MKIFSIRASLVVVAAATTSVALAAASGAEDGSDRFLRRRVIQFQQLSLSQPRQEVVEQKEGRVEQKEGVRQRKALQKSLMREAGSYFSGLGFDQDWEKLDKILHEFLVEGKGKAERFGKAVHLRYSTRAHDEPRLPLILEVTIKRMNCPRQNLQKPNFQPGPDEWKAISDFVQSLNEKQKTMGMKMDTMWLNRPKNGRFPDGLQADLDKMFKERKEWCTILGLAGWSGYSQENDNPQKNPAVPHDLHWDTDWWMHPDAPRINRDTDILLVSFTPPFHSPQNLAVITPNGRVFGVFHQELRPLDVAISISDLKWYPEEIPKRRRDATTNTMKLYDIRVGGCDYNNNCAK